MISRVSKVSYNSRLHMLQYKWVLSLDLGLATYRHLANAVAFRA